MIGLFLLASLIWFHSQPIRVRKCVLTFEKCVLSSWFFFLFSQKTWQLTVNRQSNETKSSFFFKKTIQGFKRGHTMCWICTFSAGYMSLTICSSRNDICSIEPSPCPPLRVLISSQSWYHHNHYIITIMIPSQSWYHHNPDIITILISSQLWYHHISLYHHILLSSQSWYHHNPQSLTMH